MPCLTWVEIDLDQLTYNLQYIQNEVNKSKDLIAVVKSDAYGHGAIGIVQHLINQGVEKFAVATLEEARNLKIRGIQAYIVILNPLLEEEMEEAIAIGAIPSIVHEDQIMTLHRIALMQGKIAKAHLRVDMEDTGLGVDRSVSQSIMMKSLSYSNLRIEGVYTHFATAYGRSEQLESQIKEFQAIVDQIRQYTPHIFVHAANSYTAARFPESHFDCIRPGIALYGLSNVTTLHRKLQPVMSLKSKVIAIKMIKRGSQLGYGNHGVIEKDCMVGIVPCGYMDAYFMHRIRQGHVLIRGQIAPILGQVCMDKMMVDLSQIPQILLGEEVVLLGKQENRYITPEDIAEWTGIDKNYYDILCLFGPRVKRSFIDRSA